MDVYAALAIWLNTTPDLICRICQRLHWTHYPDLLADDIAGEIYARMSEEIYGGVPGRNQLVNRFASILIPSRRSGTIQYEFPAIKA